MEKVSMCLQLSSNEPFGRWEGPDRLLPDHLMGAGQGRLRMEGGDGALGSLADARLQRAPSRGLLQLRRLSGIVGSTGMGGGSAVVGLAAERVRRAPFRGLLHVGTTRESGDGALDGLVAARRTRHYFGPFFILNGQASFSST